MTLRQDIDKAVNALQSGQAAAAFKQARALTKKAPGNAFLLNLAGMALAQSGKPRDAMAWFARALKSDPAFVEARRNAAQTQIVLGQHDKAEAGLRVLLARTPDDAQAHYLMAQALAARDAVTDARAAIDRAIELQPGLAAAWNLRGVLRGRTKDSEGAIADFTAAIARNPRDPEAHVNLARRLALKGQTDAAFDHLQQALDAQPAHEGALLQLAGLLEASGDNAGAIATNRRLLALDPGNAQALNNLAYLLTGDGLRALTGDLSRAYSAAPKSGDMRVILGFAMAHLSEKTGQPAEAATWYARANALAARLRPYDPTADAAELDRLLRPFAPGAPLVTAAASTDGPRPVFVLGLPRSGTSLTEQVLSAHPSVFGAGELATGAELAAALDPDAVNPQTLGELAAAYRAALPPMPDGTKVFVDKMPGNFSIIGHLAGAFPDAVFINLSRDPRDIALSMWRVFFAAGHAYASDMGWMAAHMNLYARAMTHWRAVLPGRIHDLAYADLVADIDAASRLLAGWVGVDWTAAMTRPEDNTRAVLTASSAQVRGAVHTRSVGKWQGQQDLLAPLVAGLDAKLWPGIGQG